ncbi:hypothetical protein [uncultured Roseivirga sp.]|uniref:hypothetical protein n=1 Tax=uncultured Roseivirga sp. TaxID=543088 RepID=UPI0030DC1A23|tara:strand:+ start:1677 stop:2927 length:1251 start_codon:yes stop_codon:yes gene_type:complete
MKKLILSLFALCLTLSPTAQTWTTSGSNIYYNDGKVGIGTSTPSAKLEVLGGNIAGGAAVISQGYNATWASGATFIDYNPSLGYGRIGAYDYSTSSWKSLAVEGGNLGIGTNTPQTKLEISGNSQNWNETIQGSTLGTLHLNPGSSIDHFGNAITFGASDVGAGKTAHAGIYVRSDGAYGTKMYFSTTNNYSLGSQTAMMIDHNGNIGIGDSNPKTGLDPDPNRKLLVNGGITVVSSQKISYDKQYYAHAYSSYDPTNNNEARFRHYGYYGISLESRNGSLILRGDNGNVGIGTTSPTEKLSVDGTVLAKKVKVSTTGADWPDFVFAPNYKLRTLNELEAYIKANQHLPEVPSAKEVEENGLDLGKMDATLLQKVEELTLYTIEQEKKIKQQERENLELKARLTKIEELIKTLTSK